MASSGADVTAGLAATYSWGRAARAITECSGIVPVLMVAAGPAVSGPALVARARRPGGDDRGCVRVRERPADGERHHRREHRHRRARRRQRARARTRDSPHSSSPTPRPRSRRSATCSGSCPRTSTSCRRTGSSDDPPDRATPELRDLVPGVEHGSYDVRDAIRSIADDGERHRAASELGRQPRHRARGDRRPSGRLRRQPAAVDRRHARHRRVAEGRSLRRTSATRSTCRSSR